MRFKSSKIWLPISWVYGLLVVLRNTLYDEHLLPVRKVSVPTICVGNLAVGGTGKTPMVEYIVRLLLSRGYKVAVLSRGYGRLTRDFVLADESATAETIGDEPMQIHCHFPDVPVAVCENRIRGIRRLMRQVEGLQCVVLDDAFQYRQLECGYNILLTSYDNLYTDDHFLPAGYLRDSMLQVRRAHAVVVSRCPSTMTPMDQRIIHTKLNLPLYIRLYFSSVRYTDQPLAGRPLVVTGIAHPEPLYAYVRASYPDAEVMNYADHHLFTSADVEDILSRAEDYTTVVTTEKDLVRMQLTPLVEQLGDKLVVIPIESAIVREGEVFDKEIVRYVSENLRRG